MKIIVISPFDLGGGAEKVAFELTKGYLRHGHQAKLLTPRKVSSFDFVLSHNFMGPSTSSPFPLPTAADLESEIESGHEIFYYPGTWSLFNDVGEPDILHLHNLHSFYFDLRALPFITRKIKTVVTLHDMWLMTGHCAHSFDCIKWQSECGDCPYLGTYPKIKSDGTAFNFQRKRDIYANCNLDIVGPSNWIIRQARRSILNNASLSYKVIRHGVNKSVFCNTGEDKKTLRERLALPVESVTFLLIANQFKNNQFKDYNGFVEVINMLAASLGGHEKVTIVALGTEDSDRIIGPVLVKFIPFNSVEYFVRDHILASDALLHFSRADTFPNVILEALSCGKPVIASNVGGIPEQVMSAFYDDGTISRELERANGILFANGNAPLIVSALLQFIRNPSLRLLLSRNALSQRFHISDFDETVRSYLDFFQNFESNRIAGGLHSQ